MKDWLDTCRGGSVRSRALSLPKARRVHLLRQADQVSDCPERAHTNTSRQADGEHKPKNLGLLAVEVADPQQTACVCGRQ